MPRRITRAAALIASLAIAGCASHHDGAASHHDGAASHHDAAASHHDGAASAVAVDLARTRPLGAGPIFRPPPVGNPAVAAGAPVGTLRCGPEPRVSYGTHVELFARDRGIAVPAGIGIAPPQRWDGAVVTGGRCMYPLRTTDPTGVVEVDSAADTTPTVGDLFELWGQPLSERRLGGVTASAGQSVAAFVNGHRWSGDPRRIPLRRHVQIVLELGAPVEPHPTYLFPPSL